MHLHRTTRRKSRAGFTIIEMAVASVILLLLGGSLATALDRMRQTTLAGTIDSKLQEAGERALTAIMGDLRRSAVAAPYPYRFDDGNATGAFAAHAHPAAAKHGQVGDPDFGANREVVYLLPQDADADGRPDLDAGGNLIYDPMEFSFVLITGVDGINYLEQRGNAVLRRRVASFVERVTFEDSGDTGNAIPLDAVRVRVWLRQADNNGFVHRYFQEAVVQLRNG